MKKYKVLFLAFAVLALALSAFLPAVDVSAADAKLATVTRVSLVGVENRTATIRVSGTHLCEKVNIVQKFEGSVITLEAQEAGGVKSCGTTPKTFVRDVKVKALMPDTTYSVIVNSIQRLTGVKIGGTGGSTGTGGTGGAVKTPVPVESSDKLAKIRKVTLVSTEPYTATIRVEGTYTCDKVRYSTDVIGKTIYIKIHDTKNRGNDCTGGGTYTRTFTFKPLVPGRYTVHVNIDEKGVPDRILRDVIIPVGATPTPAAP